MLGVLIGVGVGVAFQAESGKPGRSDWCRFINCPQHIQPRWTKEELVAREYDRDRIERLENENRQLRKELTVKA